MKSLLKKTLPVLTIISIAIASASAVAGGGDGKHKRMQHTFKRIDTNGDKVITKEEQLAFAEKQFISNDLNKDGMVTLKEIKKAHLKRRMDRLEAKTDK